MADYSGEDDSVTGFGDAEGLISFFLYSFILHPICGYILSPKRKWKKSTGICLAVGFLCSIALSKVYMDSLGRGPNYYQILGVTRSSNAMDIRKSYKRLVLELHPDKNKSPQAAQQFSTVKAAYDVLMDRRNRLIYNKLGTDGLEAKRTLDDESQLLMDMGIYYVLSGALSYLLTIGKCYDNARTWAMCGLILMLVVEVLLILTPDKTEGGFDLLSWVLPQLTERELVLILHSLYPPFMNGCRLVSNVLFFDINKMITDTLAQLSVTNKAMWIQLKNIEIAIGKLKNNKNIPTNVEGRGSGAGENSSSTSNHDSVASKLMQIEEMKFLELCGMGEKTQQTSSPPTKIHFSFPFSIFWIILAVYSAFYYVTQS